MPIAVILTIIFQTRHQLESEDLQQIDKQAGKEELEEVKKIKKQLKSILSIR